MEKYNLSNYNYVTVYKINKNEINKIDFALCNQPTETLESFYKRQIEKPDILINGGLFGLSNGNTYFTFRDEYITKSFMDKYTEGFGILSDGILIYGNYGKDNKTYKDFICGYPVLVKDGKTYSSNIGKELDYNTRRTVLAYNDNYIYIVTVESPGLNFNKLKTILIDNLNVKYAINLDGGRSTRLLYKGNRQTSSDISNRPVDNVVAIYLKTESKSNNTVNINPYILQKGSTGNSVKALQRCLRGFGYNPGIIDGDFGKNTESAVKKLQSNFGLNQTGIVKEEEWKILTGIN